jgi:hypothetical protein
MAGMKSLRNVCFLLFVLIPCVLFNASAEFSWNIKEFNLLFFAVSEGESSESGGIALPVSEGPPVCGRTAVQKRIRFDRLWKQFLSPAVFALLLKAFDKVTIQRYYLHHYFSRDFFHLLVISLFLGGRAPPRSVY